MSLFGSWKCPNCDSTWTGSIGWDLYLNDDEDRLNRLLQTMCGCEQVDEPVWPVMSSSVFNFEESDKRKELIND